MEEYVLKQGLGDRDKVEICPFFFFFFSHCFKNNSQL